MIRVLCWAACGGGEGIRVLCYAGQPAGVLILLLGISPTWIRVLCWAVSGGVDNILLLGISPSWIYQQL